MNALAETVSEFCRDLTRAQDELHEAQQEIARLRKQLAARKVPKVPALPLRKIRQGVAFHCHPDRGGDLKLMKSVNPLFDYLERCQAAEDR